jgi:hypothetical protein
MVQDGMSPERVAQACLLDQMDFPPEDLPQLLAHGYQVEQAPRRVRVEGHQDIHITVGPEVVS